MKKRKKRKIGIILISLVLLFSCSPEQRIARIVGKYPHLKQSALDTLIIHDSVVVNNYSYDTTKLVEYHDTTIIVNNEKVIAKYIFDTITNEIHHYIECKGDTIRIIREVPVEVEKIVIQDHGKTDFKTYLIWGSVFLGLIVLLFILKFLKDLFR